jgi:hypothetical protein
MEEVQIEVTVGLDLGLCLQGHTKWVGDFFGELPLRESYFRAITKGGKLKGN